MDAGLPGSFGLTRTVADYLDNTAKHFNVRELMHLVVGAMVQHDTALGGSAFDGVDVERVFAAVKALKDRESIDLSAFVENWNRSLDLPTGRTDFPAFWASEFKRGLTEQWDSRLEDAFEKGVRAVMQTGSSEMFERLESAMLEALILTLRADQNRLGYLEPMIRAESLNAVATLNYDLAVEKACERAGLSVDTGLNTWDGGYDWNWGSPQAEVKLLKLHGSLDYVLGRSNVDGTRIPGDSLSNLGEDRTGDLIGGSPAMVFGQGSKLRSDGPFLAMLVEFDRILAGTEWLTVVGYSFRDDHINAAITRWLNSEHAQRLSVIDPTVAAWDDGSGRTPLYWRQVREAVDGREAGTGSRSRYARTWAPLQHDFIAATAADGLASLHG